MSSSGLYSDLHEARASIMIGPTSGARDSPFWTHDVFDQVLVLELDIAIDFAQAHSSARFLEVLRVGEGIRRSSRVAEGVLQGNIAL